MVIAHEVVNLAIYLKLWKRNVAFHESHTRFTGSSALAMTSPRPRTGKPLSRPCGWRLIYYEPVVRHVRKLQKWPLRRN